MEIENDTRNFVLYIKISKKEKVNMNEKSFEMGVHRILTSFVITTYPSMSKTGI